MRANDAQNIVANGNSLSAINGHLLVTETKRIPCKGGQQFYVLLHPKNKLHVFRNTENREFVTVGFYSPGYPQSPPAYGKDGYDNFGGPQYGQPGGPQYGQPGAPQYGQPGAPQYGQPYPQPTSHFNSNTTVVVRATAFHSKNVHQFNTEYNQVTTVSLLVDYHMRSLFVMPRLFSYSDCSWKC